MEPKLKEKQPQHSGFQSAAGEPDKMSTSCLMPKTKRSDTEEKLTTELEEPITVHTSEPDSRQSRFWRLNDPLEASDYSKIEPMRFWDPKITCDGSCRCYPAQALQVCGLSISSKDGSPITGAKISGFFAIRDHYDRRRIYIFKHEKEDEIDIVFKNGIGHVRITTPHRGILYGDLVFDYDLNISYDTSEGIKKEEKIEGKALYNGKDRPYTSRPEIIQYTSIQTNGDSKIKETILKFIRFTQAIEAQIEIEAPEGLHFCTTVRMDNLKDEIALFDSEYSSSSGKANRNSLKLKFVLVVPLLDTLELKYTVDEEQQICKFKSLYHGDRKQDITFKSGVIKMQIKWSRM